MPGIDVATRIGCAHAGLAHHGGALGALQRVGECFCGGCGARAGQQEQRRVQSRLRMPVERRFAHGPATPAEGVEDVRVLLDEGAAEIAYHLRCTAAVFAQVDDQGIGPGQQLQRGIDGLAFRLSGNPELERREAAQVEQSDIARQHFRAAHPVVAATMPVRRWRPLHHRPFACRRQCGIGPVHAEMLVERLQLDGQRRSELTLVGERIELALRRSVAQRCCDLPGLLLVEVALLDGVRYAIHVGARRFLRQARERSQCKRKPGKRVESTHEIPLLC